jgi:hypothetical protein
MIRRLAAIGVLLLVSPGACAEGPFRFPEAKHGKGELKYRNGLPVLVAAGTPEEMGEQIGVLAIRPIAPKMKAVVKDVVRQKAGPAWPVLVKICAGLFRQFPEGYHTELEAMARAGGIDREVLIVANTIGDIQHLGGCSALVVEPARSATGQALFGRNMDTDPVGDVYQYGLVVIRRPAGKRAFASVAFPGLLMCGSEMNDAGLTLTANDVRETKDGSPPLNPQGTPLAVASRRLMEECATRAEAEQLLKGLKATTTGAAILCDTKSGAVYEATPKNVLVRRSEGGICTCTNHFRTKELATSTECWRYARLQTYAKKPKLGLQDVARALHEVNQGKYTVQSMIFEPAALRVHVALGEGPVTKRPLKALECGPLFKEGGQEK